MEWFILLVPVLLSIFVAIKYPKQTVWWEFLVTFVVCAALLFGAKLLIISGITTDTEYYTRYVARAEYGEAYTDIILVPVTIGKTTTLQPRTVHHPAVWTAFSQNGDSRGIQEATYESLKASWGSSAIKEGHRYTITWDGDIEKAQFMTTTGSYENRLQATYTVYSLPEVSKEQHAKFQLQDYPSTAGLAVQHILGEGGQYRDAAAQLLQHLNARHGAQKDFQCWIVIFRNQPEEAARLQEALWEHGNRHEYVLCLGVDDKDVVRWSKAFSWTKEEALINYGKEVVTLGSTLDLVSVVQSLDKALAGSWIPRDFSEFSYIQVDVPIWGLIVIGIVTTLGGIITLYWAVNNEIHDKQSAPNPYQR